MKRIIIFILAVSIFGCSTTKETKKKMELNLLSDTELLELYNQAEVEILNSEEKIKEYSINQTRNVLSNVSNLKQLQTAKKKETENLEYWKDIKEKATVEMKKRSISP